MTKRIGRLISLTLYFAAAIFALPVGPTRALSARSGNREHRRFWGRAAQVRGAYETKGLAVLVVDADVNLAQAVDYIAKIKRPITVIGTSSGTLRAAQGIARGARPDALMLTSGFLTKRIRQRQQCRQYRWLARETTENTGHP